MGTSPFELVTRFLDISRSDCYRGMPLV